ncbi:MAG: hypothetical protein GY830_08540 [Bacteroidetes bacterium]|nr:hypothetical protein [Bacteroidota bacterium]
MKQNFLLKINNFILFFLIINEISCQKAENISNQKITYKALYSVCKKTKPQLKITI